MPTMRTAVDTLPGPVAYLLARGALPPVSHEAGDLEAFLLRGRWLTYDLVRRLRKTPLRRQDTEAVLAELAALWRVHRAQITALTPRGTVPWVVRALDGEAGREGDAGGFNV